MTDSRSNAGFAICNPERGGWNVNLWKSGWRSLAAAAFVLLFPCQGRCADPSWRMLIEPKFMKYELSYPIAHSERAVMVPALVKDGEPVCLSLKEFQALGVSEKVFLQVARDNASVDLSKLTPAYVRNRKNVIEYATLSSESPLTASVVLSPEFLKMFGETLGSKLVVAIPCRYTIYVFPALASHFEEYTPMVAEAYHATAYPVSMEAFELSAQGLKTVGVYQEP